MAELNGVPADLSQLTALAVLKYGHYTSMRVEDRRVRGLALHLERLRSDCRQMFDAELDPDRVRHARGDDAGLGALRECYAAIRPEPL